jgi:HK97 family phage portal protein
VILRGAYPSHAEERAIRPFNAAAALVPSPGGFLQGLSSGTPVTYSTAVGLPAVAACIRLVSETLASLPLMVYRGELASKRRASDAWQYGLLHDTPSSEATSFDFILDVASSIESCGNAFIFKVKSTGRVVELHVIDPDTVRMTRDPDTGDKLFELFTGGKVNEYGTDTVMHIRGPVLKGGQIAGFSPISLFMTSLGVALAQEEFVGRYFRNDARPGVVLTFPGTVTREQAREWSEVWNSDHAGVGNAHRTAVLGAGGDVKTIPVTLGDAQFVESQNFSLAQIARMFRVPLALLDAQATHPSNTEQESLNFLNFSLLPRIRRIERAFRADPDLFGGGDLYPEFFVDEFLRTDAKTRAEVLHSQVQDGVTLVDEARAEMGRPPLPPMPADPSQTPGMVPQITPVGGAPNPIQLPAPSDTSATAA